MAINTKYTPAQKALLDDISRARKAGVEIGGECAALETAILHNLSYTAIPNTGVWSWMNNGGTAAVTDERCSRACDLLANRAYEQGKRL